MSKVLNVGGSSKAIPLPRMYSGWDHVLLDIDPRGEPDLLCDARELQSQPASTYDAVYCSHNLEHYYRHDVKRVLAGFAHVLKPDGFVHVVVPDVVSVIRHVVAKGMDLCDVLYHAPVGPITVLDVIYGYGVEIERSGNPFFAHKTGFSKRVLMDALQEAGFVWTFIGGGNFELIAYAFQRPPVGRFQMLRGAPST